MTHTSPTTRAGPVLPLPQPAKLTGRKDPAGGANFASLLADEIGKDRGRNVEDRGPAPAPAARDDNPPEKTAGCDSALPQGQPVVSVPQALAPNRPEGRQKCASPDGLSTDPASGPLSSAGAAPVLAGQNGAAQPAAGLTGSQTPVTGAAVPVAAVSIQAGPAAAAQPASLPADLAFGAVLSERVPPLQAGQTAADQPPVAMVDGRAAALAQGDGLKADLRADGANLSQPASSLPASLTPIASREPAPAFRATLEALEVPSPARQAVQVKEAELQTKASAERLPAAENAKAPPGTADPGAARVVQAAVEGAALSNSPSQIFEPARLAEAQTKGLLVQVCRTVEDLVKSQQTTLRLMLNPEELGRIDLRLTSGSNGLSVTLMAQQASTGQMLESQLAQLRQALDQAGIHLAHLSVGQQQSQTTSGQSGRKPRIAALHNRPVSPVLEEPLAAVNLAPADGLDYRI